MLCAIGTFFRSKKEKISYLSVLKMRTSISICFPKNNEEVLNYNFINFRFNCVLKHEKCYEIVYWKIMLPKCCQNEFRKHFKCINLCSSKEILFY